VKHVLLSSFIAAAAAFASTPEQDGAQLALELAQRNAGYKDLTGQVEMVLTDADGSEARRSFTLKVLERPTPADGDRSLIVFESPADVKGTAVLSHAKPDGDDEQWLFLPSARRTKRISSSNRSGAFVGSEFTFEDLTGNDGRKYTWRRGAEKPCPSTGAGQAAGAASGSEAASCIELEAVPKDPASAYSKRVLQVDAKDLRLRSIAFFDRKGELLKTLAYGDYQTLNARFVRAQKWTMRNAQTGKSTTIRFTGMKLSTGLSSSDFATGKLGN
jgi:outer membrane lipoprotein-sorting protein